MGRRPSLAYSGVARAWRGRVSPRDLAILPILLGSIATGSRFDTPPAPSSGRNYNRVVCDDLCRAWRAPYLCRPRSIARAQWLMPADHCGLSRGLRGRNTVRRAEVTGEGRRSLSTERRYHPAVEASIASASRLFRLRMTADTSVMISATGSGSRNVIA